MGSFEDVSATVSVIGPQRVWRRRARLEVLSGPDAGRGHEFEGRVRVGSLSVADFTLTDRKVSGMHCGVTVGKDLRVRDFGSKNGTFIDKVRLIEAVIEPGSEITLGQTRVRVDVDEELVETALDGEDHFFGVVSRSPQMWAVTAQLKRLALVEGPLLLQSEPGTDLEHVVAAVHAAGPRAGGPLVIVDCRALPTTVLDAELFGREGALERGQRGTLYLCYVDDLPAEMQHRLEQVLETRVIDVRLLLSSHSDLALDVA